MREKMIERNEEIFELKAERSNTKVSFYLMMKRIKNHAQLCTLLLTLHPFFKNY